MGGESYILASLSRRAPSSLVVLVDVLSLCDGHAGVPEPSAHLLDIQARCDQGAPVRVAQIVEGWSGGDDFAVAL